jgi:hypothetical protein
VMRVIRSLPTYCNEARSVAPELRSTKGWRVQCTVPSLSMGQYTNTALPETNR